jgi:hypothetical protein
MRPRLSLGRPHESALEAGEPERWAAAVRPGALEIPGFELQKLDWF